MKRLVLGSAALAILSGLALSASSAQAASYKRHYGNVTPYERAAIVRSRSNLNSVRAHARADGRVTLWERVRINAAQARHKALVSRYRHN